MTHTRAGLLASLTLGILFRRLGLFLTLAAFLMRACPNVARAANGNNPLASQPVPAMTTAGGAQVGKSTSPGGFSVLGATQTGQTIFVNLPSAQTLESAITQTAGKLGDLFDGKPALSGGFADSQTKHRGGALISAKLKGQDIRGWIFCSVANTGATATVVYAAANASQPDIATLFALMPAPLKMQ